MLLSRSRLVQTVNNQNVKGIRAMARNKVQFQKGLSEPEFERLYGTEEQCRAAVVASRWPDGFVCSECGGTRHSVVKTRGLYQCSACRTQTSPIAGTIFAATKLKLRVWFRALYHLTQTKQGISSIELGRRLGVTQTTAWKIKHKLGQVMLERDGAKRLAGVTGCCMIDRQGIQRRWEADGSKRDERGRRVFAASEARAAGHGGIAATSEITGIARSTIGRGLKELDMPSPPHGRVRREGGGPRLLTERDPTLLADLERLVQPATLGDPERPLLWVSKSLDKLAHALGDMGHAISPNSVRKLLVRLGFSRPGLTARRMRARNIPTATPSSSTSTPR